VGSLQVHGRGGRRLDVLRAGEDVTAAAPAAYEFNGLRGGDAARGYVLSHPRAVPQHRPTAGHRGLVPPQCARSASRAICTTRRTRSTSSTPTDPAGRSPRSLPRQRRLGQGARGPHARQRHPGHLGHEEGRLLRLGHISENGGPGTKTTQTPPRQNGDDKDSGLRITETLNWAADVTWTFTYDKSPVEAVIKPAGEYKQWVPAASTKQGKAGGAIGFTVELRDKKTGGKPKNTTATFQFKLLKTSAEPGSCLNSQWNDKEPDLKVLKQDNGGLAKVDEDGQSAAASPSSPNAR